MNWKSEYERWLHFPDLDRELRKELEAIHDENLMEDCFYKHLEFGTGGMRGKIGPGPNRMNKYTIRRAAEGLATYIAANGEVAKAQGVVIAYDSRYLSYEFAIETAKVLGFHGINAYVFDSLRTTPELSHAVRALQAFSGVVITASHNPSNYNGFKVYGMDGAQYSAKEADQVVQQVMLVEDELTIRVQDEKALEEQGLLKMIGAKMDEAYLEKLQTIVLDPELLKETAVNLSIVYTPLHGTGNIPVRKGLVNAGFKNVHVVKEQELPDPSFPTVKYPNPEETTAFTLAMEYGKSYQADLLLATDPDADRVGAAIKDGQTYKLLTGNQAGAIMLYYLISQKEKKNALSKNAVIIKTIVTSELGKVIAASFGIETIDVLTGFKYISSKLNEFEEKGNKSFLFGYEESYGYLINDFVRDKDAVQACLLLAEAATYYKAQYKTLLDVLKELFDRYGYYKEDLVSLTLEGKEGTNKIQQILEHFRGQAPERIAGKKVTVKEDYLHRISTFTEGNNTEPITLPKSNVLKFKLEDEAWFCLRPSGTEPKIKMYFGVKEKSEPASKKKLNEIKTAVMKIVDELIV